MDNSKVKLLGKAAIMALITRSVGNLKDAIFGIQECANQCILHAEKHGDVSLAVKLIEEVRNNCNGYVVAGLNKWFQTYSPIKIEAKKDEDGKVIKDEDGKVSLEGHLLKEGEEGFKAFDTETALANPPQDAQSVIDRGTREIKPMSIGELKGMIRSTIKRADRPDTKFAGKTKADQDAEKARVLAYGKRVTLLLDNIKLEPDVKEEEAIDTSKTLKKTKKAA